MLLHKDKFGKNNYGKSFLATCIVIITIFLVFVFTMLFVKRTSENYCIRILADSATQMASQVKGGIKTDRGTLKTIATVLENASDFSIQHLKEVIVEITDGNDIDDILVVFKENDMISTEPAYEEWGKTLDFSREAMKTPYMSGRSILPGDSGATFLYQCVPVFKDTEIIALVYGIVDTKNLRRDYNTSTYGGNAARYIIDGTTGDFLLDTWHNGLYNINDDQFRNRDTKRGFTFDSMKADLIRGLPGYTVFKSKTAGEYLYLYYVPIGVENWFAMISISEGVAMESARSIARQMYILMTFIILLLVFYLLWEWRIMHQSVRLRDEQLAVLKQSHDIVEKMASTDTLTGLKNRNSYQQTVNKYSGDVGISFGCVYIDADSLHEINNHYGHTAGDEMLKYIASSLEKAFEGDDVFRVGGDEFIVLCNNCAEQDIKERIDVFYKLLSDSEYEVSLGFEYRSSMKNIEHIILEAEQKMYQEKKKHYEKKGDISKMRSLNYRLENILMEKKDRDNFIAAISSYFMAVFVLNLDSDTTRSIYRPAYLATLLEKHGCKFEGTFREYMELYVKEESASLLEPLLDYTYIDNMLERDGSISVNYIKKDEKEVKLHIYRAADYSAEKRDTIWLFEEN